MASRKLGLGHPLHEPDSINTSHGPHPLHRGMLFPATSSSAAVQRLQTLARQEEDLIPTDKTLLQGIAGKFLRMASS